MMRFLFLWSCAFLPSTGMGQADSAFVVSSVPDPAPVKLTDNNDLFFNFTDHPGFTGMLKGRSVVAGYQSTWPGEPWSQHRFVLGGHSVFTGSRRLGLGFDGRFSLNAPEKRSQVSVSVAFKPLLRKNQVLGIGGRVGYVHIAVDGSELIFLDMLDPRTGFIFSHHEQGLDIKYGTLTYRVGMYHRWKNGYTAVSVSDRPQMIRTFAAITARNIHLSAITGYTCKFNNSVYLKTALAWVHNRYFDRWSPSILMHIDHFTFGITARYLNQSMITFGLEPNTNWRLLVHAAVPNRNVLTVYGSISVLTLQIRYQWN